MKENKRAYSKTSDIFTPPLSFFQCPFHVPLFCLCVLFCFLCICIPHMPLYTSHVPCISLSLSLSLSLSRPCVPLHCPFPLFLLYYHVHPLLILLSPLSLYSPPPSPFAPILLPSPYSTLPLFFTPAPIPLCPSFLPSPLSTLPLAHISVSPSCEMYMNLCHVFHMFPHVHLMWPCVLWVNYSSSYETVNSMVNINF